ncbi:Fur family ferric uptake transcriptional regulator [Allocatelliglobosispora scoriae]|uniref:Fur family ferric uptake transcriptional regulator n=1 Tax=Allocatelliglobosispora scoriae TaxID=643052 RepID=A0A841BT90_9ACTN|nr:transcriptional repressor [Allocatelliglobosispora scoriae]MBB5870626.1 Fur family ferric uptake transcriptional regulator [Allocatelliglobosispora scoriae]
MPESKLTELLRERGLRLTPQRQLVLDAVKELGHATPEQVHVRVQHIAAGVNITTIYRTLELLEELGLVNHAHLSHGAPTYHAGEDRHVHLVCKECGGIDELETAQLGPLAQLLCEEHGFHLDVGHVSFVGICGACKR